MRNSGCEARSEWKERRGQRGTQSLDIFKYLYYAKIETKCSIAIENNDVIFFLNHVGTNFINFINNTFSMGDFYVSIICDNIALGSKETARYIDDIADRYQCIGRGDPKLGLLDHPSAQEGNYAYVFHGSERATKFSNEILGLEHILEVRIGLARESLPRSDL